jgi:hypothetical protein
MVMNGLEFEFVKKYNSNVLENGLKFIYLGTEYRLHKIVYGENLDKVIYSISDNTLFGNSMSIEKVSKQYISLFSYDMMKQRSSYKLPIEQMWVQEVE